MGKEFGGHILLESDVFEDRKACCLLEEFFFFFFKSLRDYDTNIFYLSKTSVVGCCPSKNETSLSWN